MGIARDIFEICDQGLMDLEDSFLKRFDDADKNASSLSRKAADGTLQFPLLISRAISFETAQKIAKATEVNAASFAQIVLTMNPDMDTSNDKGAAEYIRRFHTNADTTDDVFGQAVHFVNSRDAANESCILTQVYVTSDAGLRVVKEELNEYGIEWRSGSLNSVVAAKYVKDNIFRREYTPSEIHRIVQEKLDSIMEAKKPVSKADMIYFHDKDDNYYELRPNEKVENVEGEYITRKQFNDARSKDESIFLSPKANIEDNLVYVQTGSGQKRSENNESSDKPKKQNDSDNSQKNFNELMKVAKQGQNITVHVPREERNPDEIAPGRQVVMRDLLKDNDVKKSNELAPILLHIKVIARDKSKKSEGGAYYVDFVIGVKATMHPINSEEMVTEITNACRYHDELFRFIRWTTGEISFFKDFLLNLKDSREAVSHEQGGGSPWWNRLHRMRVIANFKARVFMKNRILPNASIAITQQEVDYIKNTFGFNLMEPRFAEDVMNRYYLLCFIVVDESLEIVHFKYDGQKSYQTLSFSGLQKENSDAARQFRDILKAVGRV